MKGLYFYKLLSPYQEDVTKDCKLTINEIDHNFVTLKNSDIKDIVYDEENGSLILTQNDGEQLIAKLDLSHFTKDFDVKWDEEKTALVFQYDGKEVVIDEFISALVDNSITNIVEEIISQTITDNTLTGVGIGDNPLGINPIEIPGTYKAVECVIDKTKGEYLPNEEYIKKGVRYLTYENLNLYGKLYNYESIKKINEDLKNGWRVPTKDDWDNMLNAIELCDIDKNHQSKICNIKSGKYAGKFLKDRDYWQINEGNNDLLLCDDNCITCEGDEPQYNPLLTNGVDVYGMSVLPAGYGDSNGTLNYQGSHAEFWTLTETERTDVFTKRLSYNSSAIEQIAESPKALCSLRLVKDYNGNNFMGIETINGITYRTVLMPSMNTEHHYAIWLASNVAFNNDRYNPIAPINVDNIIDEYAYYINEWNGFTWLKKQLSNGDSLVIKVGPDGDNNREYQLIEGKLINIKRDLREEMIDILENTSVENIGEDGKYISNISQDYAKISAVTKTLVEPSDSILSYSNEGIYSTLAIQEGEGNEELLVKKTYQLVGKSGVTLGDIITIDENMTNETYVSEDIPVAGGPLADLVTDTTEVIKAGTNIQDLLLTLFCKEKYPENPRFVRGLINASIGAPDFTCTASNLLHIEVGHTIDVSAITAKRSVENVTPSKWEGFDYGYSTTMNVKEGDGNPSNPSYSTPKQVTNYTLKRTFQGFAENYQEQVSTNSDSSKTSISNFNNLKIADGENIITAYVTGASYSTTFTPNPSMYYACSNLKNTSEEKKVSGFTHTQTSVVPTNSYTTTIIGSRYSYVGVTSDRTFVVNSNNVRKLTKYADSKNQTVALTASSGAYNVVIAFPQSWGEIEEIRDVNALNAPIQNNFVHSVCDVEGFNGYKAIQYNIYVYTSQIPLSNINYTIKIK